MYERISHILNIFVTLDRNYLQPLKVMLYSLFHNNPDEHFDIYAIIDEIDNQCWDRLHAYCEKFGSTLHPVDVEDAYFADAPMTRYYPRAMYYRLLAAQLLPEELDRILYLDPDILVINEIRPLYEIDFEDNLYAAAMHRGVIGFSGSLNKLRLPNYDAEEYFNSGVLMMNLTALRAETSPKEIFDFVEKYRSTLILPDQDILNALYGPRILPLDEVLWNYDVRKFEAYRIASMGESTMDWTMANTALLHFCGKNKPWAPSYRGRYATLYKHYARLTERFENKILSE